MPCKNPANYETLTGLLGAWFQNHPGKTPQYDVCKSKRAEAIAPARSRSAASVPSKSPIFLKPGSLRPYSLHLHHC